jgi:hypothetical protein
MRLCERGPAHERSECIGCSEAISLACMQKMQRSGVAEHFSVAMTETHRFFTVTLYNRTTAYQAICLQRRKK